MKTTPLDQLPGRLLLMILEAEPEHSDRRREVARIILERMTGH